MKAKYIRVLLIEDSPSDKLLLEEVLGHSSAATFEVIHAERLAQGLEILKR